MPNLTRRRDTERPDCWNVYFGDIGVGKIGRRGGVPLHVHPWGWSCRFYPLSRRGISAGGTADSFDQARNAFAAAWLELQPRIEETDYAGHRRQRAWTAWKYACTTPVYRFRRNWRPAARVLLRVEINNNGLGDHVAAAHLETQ